MKQFNVSGDCNGCGRCVLLTNLLVETEDGKAFPREGNYFENDFLMEANRILSECPVNALTVVEVGKTNKTGAEGLKELCALLQKTLGEIELPRVTKQDIEFDSNNYKIDFGDTNGFYEYRYSSEKQAEKAALDEFNRIAYSQYRPMILGVFVQYKNDKLKPYYTFDNNLSSYYIQINTKYVKVLKEFAAEVKSISEGEIILPENFSEFNVFPWDSNKFVLDSIKCNLQEFETKSTTSGIMEELKSSSYSSLDSYKMYIDTDDREEYDGDDWRGNSKYKTKYCFCSLNDAVAEFLKDLRTAMNYADIDGSILNVIEGVVSSYTTEINKAIEHKVEIFRRVISEYEI